MPLFLFIDCCLHFHEKVAGSCNHQNSQGRIKQACPFSSYIIDYELGVLCSKEPIPIENRCKDGQTSDDDKNALYDIMHGHSRDVYARLSIRTERVPSSTSSIITFTASPGNTSSISSGHSMKHNAPL